MFETLLNEYSICRPILMYALNTNRCEGNFSCLKFNQNQLGLRGRHHLSPVKTGSDFSMTSLEFFYRWPSSYCPTRLGWIYVPEIGSSNEWSRLLSKWIERIGLSCGQDGCLGCWMNPMIPPVAWFTDMCHGWKATGLQPFRSRPRLRQRTSC